MIQHLCVSVQMSLLREASLSSRPPSYSSQGSFLCQPTNAVVGAVQVVSLTDSSQPALLRPSGQVSHWPRLETVFIALNLANVSQYPGINPASFNLLTWSWSSPVWGRGKFQQSLGAPCPLD